MAEILAGVLAAIALAGLARGFYRRTLGRKRDRYSRLRRLGTNAQVAFFSTVLGEPPAVRRTVTATRTLFDNSATPYYEPTAWFECVWIDRDYYVHAFADGDDTIHAYSVTTRSKRFRPKFHPPGAELVERGRVLRRLGLQYRTKRRPAVKLGRTRFSSLGQPDCAASWMGFHNLHYFEAFWGANPGLYQWFVYSINDAGVGAWGDDLWNDEARALLSNFAWGFRGDVLDSKLALEQALIRLEQQGEDEGETAAEEALEELDDPPTSPPGWWSFRERARVNTYSVLGPDLPFDDYPTGERLYPFPDHALAPVAPVFGVNVNRVRTIGGEEG